MSILNLPQARIPIGSAMVDGKRVTVEVDLEWMLFFSTLTARAGGVVAPNNLNHRIATIIQTGDMMYDQEEGPAGPMGAPGKKGLQGTAGQSIPGRDGNDADDTFVLGIPTGMFQRADADLTTWAGITPGTGVATALAVNVGTAGAVLLNGGALGTPSSGVGTNITGVNAAKLGGATFSAPGDIGGSTPGAITGTTGLFTGAVEVGNTVAAGIGIASTHKVTFVIGGSTYYLLASNI